jgi:hypothetical protein
LLTGIKSGFPLIKGLAFGTDRNPRPKFGVKPVLFTLFEEGMLYKGFKAGWKLYENLFDCKPP